MTLSRYFTLDKTTQHTIDLILNREKTAVIDPKSAALTTELIHQLHTQLEQQKKRLGV